MVYLAVYLPSRRRIWVELSTSPFTPVRAWRRIAREGNDRPRTTCRCTDYRTRSRKNRRRRVIVHLLAVARNGIRNSLGSPRNPASRNVGETWRGLPSSSQLRLKAIVRVDPESKDGGD